MEIITKNENKKYHISSLHFLSPFSFSSSSSSSSSAPSSSPLLVKLICQHHHSSYDKCSSNGSILTFRELPTNVTIQPQQPPPKRPPVYETFDFNILLSNIFANLMLWSMHLVNGSEIDKEEYKKLPEASLFTFPDHVLSSNDSTSLLFATSSASSSSSLSSLSSSSIFSLPNRNNVNLSLILAEMLSTLQPFEHNDSNKNDFFRSETFNRTTISSSSSSISNSDNTANAYHQSWLITLVWSLLFGSMVVLAATGNLLVMWIISTKPLMRTVINRYLLNLTLSDFLSVTFNASFNFIFMINGHWPFGYAYCIVNNFITNLTIASSVLTLMLISLDRYYAIVHPLQPRQSHRRLWISIGAIWFFSAFFSIPTLLFSVTVDVSMNQRSTSSPHSSSSPPPVLLQQISPYSSKLTSLSGDDPWSIGGSSHFWNEHFHTDQDSLGVRLSNETLSSTDDFFITSTTSAETLRRADDYLDEPPHSPIETRTLCILRWPDGVAGLSTYEFLYNLAFLILFYLIPLFTMVFALILMSRVLWPGERIGEHTTLPQHALIQSKRKVVCMLICVITVFGVCWAPYHIYFISIYLWPSLINLIGIKHIYLAFYWFAMANSLFNPICLFVMNRRLRKYIISYFKFTCCLFGLHKQFSRREYRRSSLQIVMMLHKSPRRQPKQRCDDPPIHDLMPMPLPEPSSHLSQTESDRYARCSQFTNRRNRSNGNHSGSRSSSDGNNCEHTGMNANRAMMHKRECVRMTSGCKSSNNNSKSSSSGSSYKKSRSRSRTSISSSSSPQRYSRQNQKFVFDSVSSRFGTTTMANDENHECTIHANKRQISCSPLCMEREPSSSSTNYSKMIQNEQNVITKNANVSISCAHLDRLQYYRNARSRSAPSTGNLEKRSSRSITRLTSRFFAWPQHTTRSSKKRSNPAQDMIEVTSSNSSKRYHPPTSALSDTKSPSSSPSSSSLATTVFARRTHSTSRRLRYFAHINYASNIHSNTAL